MYMFSPKKYHTSNVYKSARRKKILDVIYIGQYLLDYGCQLWLPTNISDINKIIQRSFTKKIANMSSLT